ncbi:DapH/DapD/GlmU-related protein [Aestuariivirga sp.]|uniref:DapH/DapD/GlmU-related protein n=1 Tax=Aestuariivirga sp. TaxID=2650926 RepID=UPI003BAB94E6
MKYRKIDKVSLLEYKSPRFPGCPGLLVIAIWYFINYALLNSSIPWPSRFKSWLLRLFGAQVGKYVVIKPRVRIKSPWFFSIGDNSWIGEDCWIDNHLYVKIGSDCCISQGAYLCTGNHDFNEHDFRFRGRSIVIEEGCWIGARCTVLPGTRIGRMAVVTASRCVRGTVEDGIIVD